MLNFSEQDTCIYMNHATVIYITRMSHINLAQIYQYVLRIINRRKILVYILLQYLNVNKAAAALKLIASIS